MCWCSKAERYQFTWSDKKKFVIVSILRLIKCWEKSVDIAKNFYLERDDLKLLKLLRKNYLDEIKIVYIDIASVKTLYIRLTLLRAQMSIFPIVCNVMRRLMTKSLHCTETTSWCVIACLLKASGACPQQKIGWHWGLSVRPAKGVQSDRWNSCQISC